MKFSQKLSEEIFLQKYMINGEQGPEDVFKGVAEEIARVEHPSIRKKVQADFLDMLSSGKFIPGGRILANARSFTSLKSRNYNNCFSKDALVLTNRGLIPISEVEKGDKVLTHRGNWKPVINTMKRFYTGDVNVYTSNFFSDPITVTPEHPFYQGHETWADSKDVSRVVFPSKTAACETHETIDLVEFLDDPNLLFDDSFVWKNHVKKGEHITEGEKVNRYIALSPDLAYILGVFVGDGSTFKNNTGYDLISGFSICFNEKDQKNLHKVKILIETIFNVSVNINVSGNNWYYLRKANFPLSNFFRIACGEGTKTKKIPSFIWTASKDVQQAFLQGVVDTDGTVNKNGSIECRMSNRNLVQSLQTLSILLGIYPTFVDSVTKFDGVEFDSFSYYLSGGQSKFLRENSSKIYEDDRLLKEIKSRSTVTFEEEISYLSLEAFDKETKQYHDYVYNISVMDDESYVVNNIVVHNCFTIDIEDSMEGIYNSIYEDAMISRMGGGVGFDISKLRPEGSKTSNGGEASGPISFLEVFNASAQTIQSGGSRRCLPLWYEVITNQDGTSKKIGDLVIGDLIYFDGEKYSVNEIYHNGKQDLVKIVTKNGWHVSTANHKWLVYDLKTEELVWKEAKELAKPDQGPLYAFIVPKQPFDEPPTIEPILSVEDCVQEDTIDIEVDEVHAFYAKNPKSNGFSSISHNSAHIALLDISHPDIEKFIVAKQGDGNKKLTQFNISVRVSDAFMKQAEIDGDWNLEFEGKVYKTVKARELYNKLVENAFLHNEPGIFFSDRVERDNNAWWAFKMDRCNPCGEIPMAPYSLCCLGSLNLSLFVDNPFEPNAEFDFFSFCKTVHTAVRFLDNVLDATQYPLEKIETFSKQWRRIGLGFTGLGDALAMMRIPYGSKESKKFAYEFSQAMEVEAYKASSLLAQEKGMAPGLRKRGLFKTTVDERIFDSDFIKKLPVMNLQLIQGYGLRNIGLLTCAPTGTTSLSVGNNCSSGIEPIFSLAYDRNIRTGKGEETKKETVYDYAYLKYLEWAKVKELQPEHKNWFTTAFDVKAEDAIEIQGIIQNNIDHSISKTLNFNGEALGLDGYKHLFHYAYEKGLKGFTSFNTTGSMKGILEAPKTEPQGKRPNTPLDRRDAPKRPKDLPCEFYVTSIKGQKFLVLVGLLQDSVYETFVSEMKDEWKEKISKAHGGTIRKKGKGVYDLIIHNGEDSLLIEDIAATFNHEYVGATRLLSTALRHGTPIEFVVEQLGKSMFGSWSKAMGNVLKKYIKDGEVKSNGGVCPSCNQSTLAYKEGCMTCTSCGWSRCA